MLAIPVAVEWLHVMVWVCISLVTSGAEPLFRRSLATCASTLKKGVSLEVVGAQIDIRGPLRESLVGPPKDSGGSVWEGVLLEVCAEE